MRRAISGSYRKGVDESPGQGMAGSDGTGKVSVGGSMTDSPFLERLAIIMGQQT